MGKLIFELSDEERALVEAHRIRLGLRSHAETLRALIRGRDGEAARVAPDVPRPPFSHGRAKTVVVPAKRTGVDVPTLTRPHFNPQPKAGKAKR